MQRNHLGDAARFFDNVWNYGYIFTHFERNDLMPTEGVHHRASKQRYTIVVLPADKTGSPKQITVGKFGIAATAAAGVLVVASLVIGLLAYTPVGMYLPIRNPDLENRYHKQVRAIQDQLGQLSDEVLALREYNVKLRRALGEGARDTSAAVDLPVRDRAERRSIPERQRTGERTQPVFDVQKPVEPMVRTARTEFPMMVPARGYVTATFDSERKHFGMDIAGTEGSIISAAAEGIVIFSGWTYDDGYMIMIAHGDGFRTVYKHNRGLLKTIASQVHRGESIALLGNSGQTSAGPHLHFEVWKDGSPQDPRAYLLDTH